MQKISHLYLEAPAALPAHLARERQSAIDDLIAQGHIQPAGNDNGPYAVRLSIEEGRLAVRLKDAAGVDLTTHVFALGPYRRIIHDYFLMIESFEAARAESSPGKLEAIDMGRRGLHNEGAELLQSRLKGKIDMDHDTARRLFTLVCVLIKSASALCF
jgi:uncharacterized protein (UPF0262 family)